MLDMQNMKFNVHILEHRREQGGGGEAVPPEFALREHCPSYVLRQ